MKIYFLNIERAQNSGLSDMLRHLGHETEWVFWERSDQPAATIQSPLVLSRKSVAKGNLEEALEIFQGPLLVSPCDATGQDWAVGLQSMVLRPLYILDDRNPATLQLSIDLAMHSHEMCASSAMVERTAPPQDVIFVRAKGVYHKISKKEILTIKSDRVYLEILLQNGAKLVVRESLSRLFGQLGLGFYRVSRSFIINLDNLKEIGSDYLKVGTDRELISRKNRAALLMYLNCHNSAL